MESPFLSSLKNLIPITVVIRTAEKTDQAPLLVLTIQHTAGEEKPTSLYIVYNFFQQRSTCLGTRRIKVASLNTIHWRHGGESLETLPCHPASINFSNKRRGQLSINVSRNNFGQEATAFTCNITCFPCTFAIILLQ